MVKQTGPALFTGVGSRAIVGAVSDTGFENVRFLAADELRRVLGAVDAAAVDGLVAALRVSPRVFVAGAGRSGLALRGFAMRLMHMGFDARVVGDVTTPALAPGDLLVIGSGSGATGGLVSVSGKARSLGGRIALLTTIPDSPIGRDADVVVTIPAPTPKAGSAVGQSRQPMASLFEQALWVLLDTTILLLMEAGGVSAESMFRRHANLE